MYFDICESIWFYVLKWSQITVPAKSVCVKKKYDHLKLLVLSQLFELQDNLPYSTTQA